MHWLGVAHKHWQSHEACVVVRVVACRGHAPRNAGASMVVTAHAAHGSIGGGNLEALALQKARAMLDAGPAIATEVVNLGLRPGEFGAQCCGGEVTLVLEVIQNAQPNVTVFGAGHVGLALVKILATLPLDVALYDLRDEMLTEERFANLEKTATLRTHKLELEGIAASVDAIPKNASVLVMTHDHAADLRILTRVLQRQDLAHIGLIGSSVKWQNFKTHLSNDGFDEASLARVATPVGIAGIRSKRPAVIAVAIAAQLLQHLELSEG